MSVKLQVKEAVVESKDRLDPIVNKYQEQWEAIQAVIQLLEEDWISEGCYKEIELDCISCQAILTRNLLKEYQKEYWELVE